MEKVKGYLTVDGKFFADENQARLHEAEERLTDTLVSARVDPAKVMSLLDTYTAQIEEYINARKQVPQVDSVSDIDSDQADDTRTSEDTSGDFEQPTGSAEPVSNVGRRSRSKRV